MSSKKQINIPEKVLKYETFLNDVLKEELKKNHIKQDHITTEMAEYVQLKSFIQTLKDTRDDNEEEMLRTKVQVDVGCNFFIQARIKEKDRILVCVGCGYYIDLNLDEALHNIEKRVNYLDKQMEILRNQSASTKAHIKLALLGLAELQKL